MSDKLTTEQIEALRARLNRAVEHEALYNSDGLAESRELIAFQYDAVDMVAALLAALDAAQAENARLRIERANARHVLDELMASWADEAESANEELAQASADNIDRVGRIAMMACCENTTKDAANE